MEDFAYKPETIIMFHVLVVVAISIVTFCIIDEYRERKKFKDKAKKNDD